MSAMTKGKYAVSTYRNTDPSTWWKMLNEECRKLGIPERSFGDAYDAYEMGESPESAAANFQATED